MQGEGTGLDVPDGDNGERDGDGAESSVDIVRDGESVVELFVDEIEGEELAVGWLGVAEGE